MPKADCGRRGVTLIHLACFACYRGDWGHSTLFLALEEGVNLLPDFRRSCKVSHETDADGMETVVRYVLK